MSSVSVEEGDAGVRVEAASPHLVSLGGGRLSTAVTIHPLPQGRTVLGSGRQANICVKGSGVEEEHCTIDNHRGVLILSTRSSRTTVDGLPVSQPTRLTQGCIIGLGHSSYFRFNHPDQARMIKKSLPDPKATMLPLTFYQGACVAMDGNSPYHHQESRSRDAEGGHSALPGSGFLNGHISNGDSSPGWRHPLPSPSYNRDPSPFSPLKPPLHTSSPIQYKQNEAEEPKRNQRTQEDEPFDLDEILAICSEYQRENQVERSSKPVQNRIKTNGSLPRERRIHSPVSPTIQHSFTFETSDLRSSNEAKEKCKDTMKKTIHTYENVVLSTGSPRPRIKTFLNKDNNIKDHLGKESNGYKPSSTSDYEKVTIENSEKPVLNTKSNGSLETSQPVVMRNHPVSRGNSAEENPDKSRPSSIAEVTLEKKYTFLGFDPRKERTSASAGEEENGGKTDLRHSTSSPSPHLPSSPPSWTNPKLDCQNFPDYEMVNGGCDEVNSEERPGGCRNSKGVVKDLKQERDSLLRSLQYLKGKITDLELQEEEQIRETEIEEALVCGELEAQDEKLKQEERRVEALKEKARECDEEMEKCLERQAKSQNRFKIVNEKHLNMIDILERKIQHCSDPILSSHLRESLREQQELLDAERRSHEVLEFQLVEEEASWLSRREDLQKEIDEVTGRLEARKHEVDQLHKSPQGMNNNLELLRISHLKAIEEGRSRLNYINAELERISKNFPSAESISTGSPSKVVGRRVTSQDDLDRICKVTSGAPIDMGSSNSLGRRTIASLKEIERNRQLHLVNQGSLVIEEERQRVEELKRRVQDEVKAQWEQQRNSNCQSLTSITSDESSLEPTRDSGVSSEEVEKNNPSEDMKPYGSISGEQTGPCETPESRPLSDASGYSDDQLSVKMRSKSTSNLQRPLTRYLPIKSESLNLRVHIETAGHQVELCSHVRLDATSCRGYLSKMGSRFRTWRKRWFVFDRLSRTFAYYTDPTENKRRGGVHFEAIEEVYVDHLNSFKSPNPKVTFVVKSSTRSYNLIAPSPEAMRIWVDVIFTGAEGYQQYFQH